LGPGDVFLGVHPGHRFGATVENTQIEMAIIDPVLLSQLLAKEAFEQSRTPCHLHVVACGEEATGFLRRTGSHEMAPRPGLILLDLNRPGRGGLDVLAGIKADRDLKPSRWWC